MNEHLAELFRQQKIIRDRVRGVFYKQFAGIYLYGRPGTSKTHTVLETLKTLRASYAYNNGHLTSRGLFELIDNNSGRVIVMDDLATIFKNEISTALLMGALGNRNGGAGVREVVYQKAGIREVVKFTGGIIGISNLALNDHTKEIRRALNDRVFTINYDPTDKQLLALMEHIAGKGHSGLTVEECFTVLYFLMKEMEDLNIRPSIRMFVDKALKDFALWKMGNTETHWQDLVRSSIQEAVIELTEPTNDLSKKEETEAELRIAQQIYQRFDKPEQVKEWVKQTEKSQATYYRRIKTLKSDGHLKEKEMV